MCACGRMYGSVVLSPFVVVVVVVVAIVQMSRGHGCSNEMH